MKKFFPATEHKHYADAVNPLAREICWNLVAASGFAKIVVDTVNTQQVWYSAEDIFFKQGPNVGRTPWHQDATYSPYGGGAMVRSVAQLRVVVGAQFT